MELKWLAGFFDGEGSIGVYFRNQNKNKTSRYGVLVVSLAQSGLFGEQILTELRELYGGSVYSQHKENHKLMWKWNISADKAVRFLLDIQPHVQIKFDQIQLGLMFQELKDKSDSYDVAVSLANKIKQLKSV